MKQGFACPTYPFANFRKTRSGQISESSLADEIKKLEIEIDDATLGKLEAYCRALWDENTRMNLTRHTDAATFVARDLLDTWRLSQLIRAGEEVLDIGTGGGVPGVVLAILRPDLTVHVCDSVQKKAAAVERIVKQIGVQCEVHPFRAEEVLEDIRVNVCVARAVGPLWKICQWLRDSWVSAGRLLAIKGPRWKQEKQDASIRGALKPLNFKVAASYPMPGTESESVILKLWAKGAPER